MQGLFYSPRDYSHIVVTIAEDIVTGRQAVLRTIFLHLVELLDIEFVISHDAPIVGG